MMIQLFGRSTNFVQKVQNTNSVRTQLIGKVESFLKSNFHVYQEHNLGQTQNH